MNQPATNLIKFPTRKHDERTSSADTLLTDLAREAIAEADRHVDQLIGLFKTRSAEKGHQQALSDLTGLGLVTDVLRTNALAILMVAIGRLAVASHDTGPDGPASLPTSDA
jgi:hypothetical protein